MTTPIRRGTARKLGIRPPQKAGRTFQAMAEQLSTFALGLIATTSQQAREQIKYYETVDHGRQLGLTSDEVTEVISTVREWHQPTGATPPSCDIRQRLILRAAGEDWRPKPEERIDR